MLVIYTRVSTDEQADSGHGLHAQLDACEVWASSRAVPVLARFSDEGVSGAAKLEKRPGLLAAIDSVPKDGILLVAKRDRLSRDPLLAAMIEAGLTRKHARVVSVAGEGTEDDDPASVLMRRMVDAFAEYERLIIGVRTKAALAAKRKRGEKTGGQVPYGFGVRRVGGVRKLEPEPTEQAAIAAMRELRDAGVSLRGIGARLDERGIHPRKGNWHPETIKGILERV